MSDDYGAPEASESDHTSGVDAAYDALMARTRGALEASADLAPSEWVRVRAGIDEGIESTSGAHWAWLATAVAAASALLISLQPGALVTPHTGESVSELASTQATPASGSAGRGLEASGRPEPLSAGQVIVTSLKPETLEAFGRHRLVLAPRSELEVLSWAPTALAVHLKRGEVAANIAKAMPGERVEIRTDDATARVVGTTFTVALEESGATRVVVQEGVVEVTSRGETTTKPTRVTAGKTHRVKARRAKAPARARPAKRRPASRAKDDGYRLIEIDVPPQKAPNAR
jgi:hypothetical protein